MQLKELIEQDLIKALKAKDEFVVSVLRMLKSAWQNLGIELRADGKEISEEDLLKILKKEVKKRKESIEMFIQGARQDLADKELQEIEIIKKYLPEDLSDDKIKETLRQVVEAVEDDLKDNFGILMKKASEELKEKFDGSRVSKILKEIISEK